MSDPFLILADLDSHADLFDLSGILGDALLDVAAADVGRSFDEERDPDGTPWFPLSSKYFEWKSKAYPGNPIGVLRGNLRPNLIGDRRTAVDSAELDIGATDQAKDEAAWMHEGDELHNRPARRLGELSAEGVVESDHVLDNHFRAHTR